MSSLKYKGLGSAGKAIRGGLLDCAVADIKTAVILFGKNFDTNTASDAREACNATSNFGTN
jgi:hypothetical protein